MVLGIGDDAAVWQPSRSHLSAGTTDALVDGVHFDARKMSARAVGHRAMASNLSDIAAMGAQPVLATIALGVAPGIEPEWIVECYRGLAALAGAHGASIAGGDIVRAPALTLSITVIGEVSRTRLRTRSGGKAGDVLAVTGRLGASRAGLELLRRELDVDAAAADTARAAFATPEPRVREGRWLAASTHVHAMMDCSDGLSTDVARLAAASGCGATLTDAAVHPAAAAVAQAAGDDPMRYALDGGEDFELIVAVAPRAFRYLSDRFAQRFGGSLHPVGTLDREAGLRVREAGGVDARALVPAGFDHLAGAPAQGFKRSRPRNSWSA